MHVVVHVLLIFKTKEKTTQKTTQKPKQQQAKQHSQVKRKKCNGSFIGNYRKIIYTGVTGVFL